MRKTALALMLSIGTLTSTTAFAEEHVRTPAEEQKHKERKKTVERVGGGTAAGAVIGGLAGGGKGAAVGAVVGGGAGAGSVFIQGRNDLQLTPGTEITIRASAPNRRAMR
jgi:outer membrane lipoprotein SlyB